MKTNSPLADDTCDAKVYINPADDDLYFTSDAALESPVDYIVIS